MQQEGVDKQSEPPLLILEKWTRLKHRAMCASRNYELPRCDKDGLRMAEAYLTEKLWRVTVGSMEDFEINLQKISRTLEQEESEIAQQQQRGSSPGHLYLQKIFAGRINDP